MEPDYLGADDTEAVHFVSDGRTPCGKDVVHLIKEGTEVKTSISWAEVTCVS